MPKPCGIHQVSGVPASDVLTAMQDFLASNPISVSREQGDDGNFTVTAVFPPCVDTSGAPSSSGMADRSTPPVAVPAAAAPTAAAPLATANGLSRGFDANRECTQFLAKVVAAKVDFVVRYYSHSGSKNLTFAEARAFSDAGIDLVTVWESAGDHAGFFTRAQGVDDATSAHNMAVKIGQPAGTPIYFAVDFDATPADVNAGVVPYFQGVAAGFATIGHGNPAYSAGVYGSGFVCDRLFQQGLVTHTWLSMSSGFLGSRTYKDWHIRQHLEADPFGFGFSIDPNEAKHGYGGFRLI